MYRLFYTGNPLLLLPVLSMFLFAGVFIAAVVRAIKLRHRVRIDELSALPLLDDSTPCALSGDRHE